MSKTLTILQRSPCWFLVTVLVIRSENMLCAISMPRKLLRFALWPQIWPLLCFLWALGGWSFNKCQLGQVGCSSLLYPNDLLSVCSNNDWQREWICLFLLSLLLAYALVRSSVVTLLGANTILLGLPCLFDELTFLSIYNVTLYTK